MTKEELSRAYTHKKVQEKIVSDISEFMPSDIIQAYEDGFDKAVEVACELIERLHLEIAGYPVCLPDQFVEDFKAKMEEGA